MVVLTEHLREPRYRPCAPKDLPVSCEKQCLNARDFILTFKGPTVVYTSSVSSPTASRRVYTVIQVKYEEYRPRPNFHLPHCRPRPLLHTVVVVHDALSVRDLPIVLHELWELSERLPQPVVVLEDGKVPESGHQVDRFEAGDTGSGTNDFDA